MPAATYRVNEIFYSLQGEGGRAGEASVFVRFAGCNLQCAVEAGDKSPGGFDCDTEFTSGRALALPELVEAIADASGDCRWVVFTGGEPGLQLDERLVAALHAGGYRLAIETNGTVDLSALPLDWVTVSPKVAEHAIRQRTATEVKYVRGDGQGIPRTTVHASLQFISPAWGADGLDAKTLAWCIQLVKENPSWRLSLQQHKVWRVR